MRIAGASGGVIVAYCHDEQSVGAKFHRSMMMLMLRDSAREQIVDIIDLESGPRIPTARNTMTRAFMDHPSRPEWCLMVDADMSFGPDAFERTLAVADPIKAPIVGGLCFAGGSSGVVKPTIRIITSLEPLTIDTLYDYPQDELIQVDATGAAWLLIHRSVFEKVEEAHRDHPYTWFADSVYGGNELGEDITFCLRARQLGIPVHVHTGIHIGHMKMQVLDQDSYLEYRRGITKHGEDRYRAMQRARVGVIPGVQDRLDPEPTSAIDDELAVPSEAVG